MHSYIIDVMISYMVIVVFHIGLQRTTGVLPRHGSEVKPPHDFARAYGMNGKTAYVQCTSQPPDW
jgi:hypothetical protein